jgi:alpha-tubulin suppressor-like RCC1 family protein
VRCWGWNLDGQVGDGTTAPHFVPSDVEGMDDGVRVSAGYNFSCALTQSGGVSCWGTNANGQLGAQSSDHCREEFYQFTCSVRPLAVDGLGSGISAVRSGFAHSCAVTTAGGVKCWGFNLYGQLGDSTTTDRTSPIDVSDLGSGVTAVAPGDVHTCALMTNSTVRCWGNDILGELGIGTLQVSRVPVAVCSDETCAQHFMGAAQLAAGDYHTCALTTVGDVYCWGSDESGQLGINGAGDCPNHGNACSAIPMRVSGLDGPAVQIAAAGSTSCALIAGGTVQCWGRKFGYRDIWTAATHIEGWSGVTSLAIANDHACAIAEDASLSCFGTNLYGELGDGSAVDRDGASPRRVWLFSDRGDADCNDTISSLDALLVLELVAGLIGELPCPAASAGADAPITSTDALAILQFSAGLLA